MELVLRHNLAIELSSGEENNFNFKKKGLDKVDTFG